MFRGPGLFGMIILIGGARDAGDDFPDQLPEQGARSSIS